MFVFLFSLIYGQSYHRDITLAPKNVFNATKIRRSDFSEAAAKLSKYFCFDAMRSAKTLA